MYAGLSLCYHDDPVVTACWRRVRAGEELGILRAIREDPKRQLPRGMERLRIPARTP